MDSLYRAETLEIQEEAKTKQQQENFMSKDGLTMTVNNLQDICSKLTNENNSLHSKLKELIDDNFKLIKQLEDLHATALDVVKLPIGKVKTFLALCQPREENDDTFFYVKVENGTMTRIVRSSSELVKT